MKKMKNIGIVLLLLPVLFSGIFFKVNSSYGAVGEKFVTMNAKYKMKKIPISGLVMMDPYLLNFNKKGSGISAYKFVYKGVKFKAVFNSNNICFEEFAIGDHLNSSMLAPMIGRFLYDNPVSLKVIYDIPFQYEEFAYGTSIGRVIYSVEYLPHGHYVSKAVMPSMSPDGDGR